MAESQWIYSSSAYHIKNNDFTIDANNEKNKLIAYLKTKQMNIDITFDNFYDAIAYDGLPNNYGKIPSKEELYNFILNYHIKHKFQITINKDEIKNEDVELELKEYLIKLSNYIIDYYNDLDDYEISCSYNSDKEKNFKGKITINKEYININVDSINKKIKR